LRCVPNTGGTTETIESCTWNRYFEGSDVALTSGSEDVDGAILNSDGNIYLTTTGNFNVTGLSGTHSDVFVCNDPVTGSTTTCASFSMFFDGSANGITDDLDAISMLGLGDPPPQVPAPALFDTFSLPNGPLGSNWSGATAINSFRIRSGQVQSRPNSGSIWMNTATLGAAQEAFMTLTSVRPSNRLYTRWQGLILKLNGGDPDSLNASAIEVRYASTVGVQVRTKEPNTTTWIEQAVFPNITLTNGDQFSAQALANGMVIVLQNGVPVGTVDLSSGPNPWSLAQADAGGYIGVNYTFSNGRFDDFGGTNLNTAALQIFTASLTALGRPAPVDVKDTEIDINDPFEGDNDLFIPFVLN
ncbi:MAG: hypothetical protein KDE19_02200, partial [Caldilineaceae bacterium]|nr:hypothetical protein [Caldilineaceae bacterium]